MKTPTVVLAVDSLAQTASGIARVARLMARVLAAEVAAGRVEARALTLRGDPSEGQGLGLAITSAHDSRARFVAEVHHAALHATAFLYDFSGIARAHPRVGPLARPYLTWLHGIEAWEDAEEKRLMRARAAQVLVANSSHTLQRARGLHAGLSHAQVCWLATESDEPAVTPAQMDATRAPAVTILARLDEGGGYKGHRELIACWLEVVREVPSATLRIVGDGPGREVIAAWVAASPARAQIELLGLLPEAAVHAVLLDSSALAMPSRGEGFGLAYAEAMRHGLPVIGSVHDAAAEINRDGVTGFNVDLEDPRALPARIVSLLAQPERARVMGYAALEHWHRHLRWTRFAERFAPLMRATWGERPR